MTAFPVFYRISSPSRPFTGSSKEQAEKITQWYHRSSAGAMGKRPRNDDRERGKRQTKLHTKENDKKKDEEKVKRWDWRLGRRLGRG